MLLSSVFESNNQEGLKKITKLLALNVRDELEDFHVAHIPDTLMPELNIAIRNGIYNALFILANFEMDEVCRKYFNFLAKRVPEYWEDPNLLPELENVLAKFDEEFHFQSAFLDEQYKMGNIQRLPNSNTFVLSPSFDFKEVDYHLRHKHRDKIRLALKKEKFGYDQAKGGYVKGLWQ